MYVSVVGVHERTIVRPRMCVYILMNVACMYMTVGECMLAIDERMYVRCSALRGVWCRYPLQRRCGWLKKRELVLDRCVLRCCCFDMIIHYCFNIV